MVRPTPIIARMVPTPTPTRCPANTKLKTMVMVIFVRSKQFFVKPTLLWIVSAMAYTMPSPGFGTMRILSDMAAPMPVRIMAMTRTINRMAISSAVL